MDDSLGKIKLLAPVTTCTFVPNEPLTACETVIPGETFAPSETLAPSATFKPSVSWDPTDRGERLALLGDCSGSIRGSLHDIRITTASTIKKRRTGHPPFAVLWS